MSRYARQAPIPLAAVALALAFGWWWRTYGDVVSYGYLSWKEAGRCLVSDNDICSLARSLCLGAHPRNFLAYASGAFWGALALLSFAMWLRAPRRA